jgi:hypothetical protein
MTHDNLRRVSKSPLLHPFTRHRSGTLDWRVTRATSADSSTRLIHTILHQSPGYFDHVLEVIVIIFKTFFENDQNILTSSSSMGFLPIKLMIIIISSFSIFSFIYFSTFV